MNIHVKECAEWSRNIRLGLSHDIVMIKLKHQTKSVVICYSMVGVAVAMVISTMQEKSCKDPHNAGKFKKISKIQSFAHLASSMMKLRKYYSHEFIKLLKLYDAIIQKVISNKIEPEFVFKL